MKSLAKFLLILTLFSICECKNYTKLLLPSNNIQATAQAIADVIETFFIQQNIIYFDFVILDSFKENTLNIINDVRARLSPHVTQVRFLLKLYLDQEPLLENAVIFNAQDKTMHTIGLIPFNDIRLITYLNGSVEIKQSEIIRKNYRPSEYVIWETSKSIQLLTKEVYANGRCIGQFHSPEDYIKLNSFNPENLVWEKSLTYFEKNQNFGQCMVIFTIFNLVQRHFNKKKKKHLKELEQIEDMYSSLFDILSKAKNFTPAVENLQMKSIIPPKRDFIPPDHRFSSELMGFGKKYPSIGQTKNFGFSLPLENDEIFLIVTPGEPYTNYEKLLLPFDAQTWKYLLITFGCAFVVISGINLMPRIVKNLVYGETVKTPAYNVLGKFQITCLWQIFKINLNFQEHSLESAKCGYHPVILDG
jgi:hypothetical protein